MIHPDKIFGRLGNRLFQMAYIYAQMKEGEIPDVYVQHYHYFDKYKEEIMQLFGEGIGYTNYVSIHIRRGDYVGNPFYVDLTRTDYYQKAIEMFPNDKFIVFSDDIPWCRVFLNEGDRFAFSEGNSEIDDLNLMASCHSNIIANSSYSWWAGYLNPNPTKKVVAPKQWFSDGAVDRITLPPEWIVL